MLSVYNEYSLHGVEQYYEQFSQYYYNPHEQKIISVLNNYVKKYLNFDNLTILDFACGDGLISKYIKNNFNQNNMIIEGCDPYFKNKWVTYNLSFDDVIHGKLIKHYDIVICCYAYHLLEQNKRYDFLTQLYLITKLFIIITPSKKINIEHQLWKVIKNERIDKITFIVLKKKKFDY